MVRAKICCIASVDEAHMAIRLGASALGLVSAMPSGPGVIPDERIAEIAAAIPPPIARFLLTSATDAATIAGQQRRSGANTIQLCDRLPPGAHATLRSSLPGISVVQVVHVTGPDSVAEALEVAAAADALLLDSGNPSLPVKRLGGTGRTHDWSLSAEIVRRAPIPVFLAGGLTAGNVVDAIRTVRPFAVDVCSGVRTAGRLDEEKLAGFMAAVALA